MDVNKASTHELRKAISSVMALRKQGCSLSNACGRSGLTVDEYKDARQIVRDLEAETL